MIAPKMKRSSPIPEDICNPSHIPVDWWRIPEWQLAITYREPPFDSNALAQKGRRPSMTTISQILDLCTLGELKSCAYDCLTSDGGTRSELISRLVSGCTPDDLLLSLRAERLRRLCRTYGLPVSGSKDVLIRRLLQIATIPGQLPEPEQRRR